MNDGFDDLFANGNLEPESEKQKRPLGLVVAAKATREELEAEHQAYLAQFKARGMFTPDFSEEDEDGNDVDVPYQGDNKRR
jgi:hypothetical protein